jgi:hypothetical protein
LNPANELTNAAFGTAQSPGQQGPGPDCESLNPKVDGALFDDSLKRKTKSCFGSPRSGRPASTLPHSVANSKRFSAHARMRFYFPFISKTI